MSSILEAIYNLFRNLGSALDFAFDFLKSGISYVGSVFSWMYGIISVIPGMVGAALITVLCIAILLMILGR